MNTSIPVSCLVYLFGDLFVGRRVLWWGRETLPWRPIKYVGKDALSRMILVSTFVSLAQGSQLLLAPGQRQDEGLFFGKVMGTMRDTVWVTKQNDLPGIDGYLENRILRSVEDKTSVYRIVKQLIPYGLQPWDAVLHIVRHDLLQRGHLRKKERRWLATEFALSEGVEQYEEEGFRVKRMINDFKAREGELYDRLYADVQLAFRTELDRMP